jgi:enoyl-CoA hydratase/carnithine racemase
MKMSDQVVLVERRDRSLWMRLNRPGAMNSLTPAVLEGIEQALDQALSDADVMCVVLTGTGRAFCAGADLKFVRKQTANSGPADFLEGVLRVMKRLDSFPKPVVTALNGITLAGGLELVLCCDIVLAARSAKIGDAHANYGLLPGGGSSVRLPRVIGVNRAKYLLFTGDFVSADAMHSAGLVNEVVDDDKLEEAVQALTNRIATKSPLGLQRMKALLDDGLEQPEETALRLELLASELHGHSEDLKEGLAAFEEKRAPRFTGR